MGVIEARGTGRRHLGRGTFTHRQIDREVIAPQDAAGEIVQMDQRATIRQWEGANDPQWGLLRDYMHHRALLPRIAREHILGAISFITAARNSEASSAIMRTSMIPSSDVAPHGNPQSLNKRRASTSCCGASAPA